MSNGVDLNSQSTEIEQDALFYYTAFTDHLNELIPEHSVLKRKNDLMLEPARPNIGRRHLLKGPVSGVEQLEPAEGLEGWEYWQCNLTNEHLQEMNVKPEFIIDDKYIDQMPDAWNIDGLLVNAKARESYEKHAPGTCIFFPATIYSKKTGEDLELERWILVTRHWVYYAGEKEPFPSANFHVGSDSALIRTMQTNPKVCAALEKISLFSRAIEAGRMPFYSHHVFQKLKSEGLTGLKEKTSKSRTFHEMREVIGHVWRI
jgi:hypothetical protein